MKSLLEHSPLGFALHEILLDESDHPVDYVFLEVNREFENQTGFKREELIGKPVTRVLPNLKEDSFDWITLYGEVALNGAVREFEQYSTPLKRWFRVKAYSPERGKFITMVQDITREVTIARSAEDFLQDSERPLDYHRIADTLREFSGARYVAFNRYHEGGREFTTEAISGVSETIKKAGTLLGYPVEGHTWPYDPSRADRTKDQTITRFADLLELTGSVIPRPVIRKIIARFELGPVYFINVRAEGRQIGDFTVFMGKGENLCNEVMVDLYTRQVGLMMARQSALQDKRESEEKYRMIFDNSPVGLVHLDKKGIITACNPRGGQILGHNSGSVTGTSLLEMRNRKLTRAVRHCIQGESSIFEGWINTPETDGDIVLRALFVPVPDGSVGILEDMTERRMTEDTLEAQMTYQRMLMETIPIPIFHTDAPVDGFCRVLGCNKSFEEFMHRKREQVIGNTFDQLLPREFWEPLLEIDREIVATGEPLMREIPWPGEKGQIRTVILHKAMYRHPQGNDTGMIGAIINITHMKETEQRLADTMSEIKELARKAEEASAAKSEFLANMSHEIRTPLNGVIGMTGLLQDTKLTSQQRQYADIVKTSGENLLSLLNDILDFSKIEARKLELENLEFGLHNVLEDTTDILAVKALEKGLDLTCWADQNVPGRLKGDPGRLRQILVNLAGNALKFTPRGEVSIRASLVSREGDRARIRFSVRDTGIGIPQDRIARLFAPFTQVDGSTTRRYGGTGLGLMISKQLAEMMGGTIGLNSQEGAGSEFWFTAVFPVLSGGNPVPPDSPLAGSSVLIASEAAGTARMLEELLSGWGASPVTVNDPERIETYCRERATSERPVGTIIVDQGWITNHREAFRQCRHKTKSRFFLLAALGEGEDFKDPDIRLFDGVLTRPLKASRIHTLLSGNNPVPPVEPEQNRPTAEKSTRRVRILVVEDNPSNQTVARVMLTKLGYHADFAANGREALECLARVPYALVFMDCQMPELDGWQTTEMIRKGSGGVLNPRIPIVAMTAFAMAGDRDKCVKSGMNDYLPKPVLIGALQEMINRWAPGRPEEVPETDESVFRQSRLLDRLDGDRELAREILAAFTADMPVQLTRLREQLNQGDTQGATRTLHSIKGAAANVEAIKLKEMTESHGDHLVESIVPQLEREFTLFRQIAALTGWL